MHSQQATCFVFTCPVVLVLLQMSYSCVCSVYCCSNCCLSGCCHCAERCSSSCCCSI